MFSFQALMNNIQLFENPYLRLIINVMRMFFRRALKRDKRSIRDKSMTKAIVL